MHSVEGRMGQVHVFGLRPSFHTCRLAEKWTGPRRAHEWRRSPLPEISDLPFSPVSLLQPACLLEPRNRILGGITGCTIKAGSFFAPAVSAEAAKLLPSLRLEKVSKVQPSLLGEEEHRKACS